MKVDGFTETNKMQLTPHSRFDFDKSTLETDDVKGILIDPLEEDDHEDFELYDIIVQSENIEDFDVDIVTDEQKQRYVDLHNLYRANFTYPLPEGSNMKMVEWNNTLEWSASEYAKMCIYKHGQAKTDNMTYAMGQNLYKGSSSLLTRHIWMFYYEFVDWNFVNQTCNFRNTTASERKIQCGHFTQVMWAYTQHIGCARRSHCWPRETYQHILVNCHYFPGGNWKRFYHIDVYKYGTPCTRSELSDGNLCFKNLTVDKRMCHDYNLDCECVLDCKNCAKPNFETCRCDCKEGWDYPDCGEPCEDTYHWVYPHIPKICPHSLTHPEWYPNHGCNYTLFMILKCRKTCGFCPSINQSTPSDELCCAGKKCNFHNVLNTETCECEKDCPTFGCLYEKPKTMPLRSPWPPKKLQSSCTRIQLRQILLLAFILFVFCSN